MRTNRKMTRMALGVVAGATALLLVGMLPRADLAAQNQGERKGGNPGLPDPISHDSNGFTAIFDGKSLKGWDGDPSHWRAEGGLIVGETSTDNPLKINTFLIWRGGKPANFELKLDYRINSTNSGVQYRSVELPDVGKWVLKGYQADIDAENTYTGQIYEERGRGFIALRGQFSHIAPGQKPRVTGNIGDGEALKSVIKVNDWNSLHLIARDNVLIQILNDQVMSMAVDDDTANRKMDGLIGFQLHRGPAMKLEIRNVMLKNL